MSDQPRPHIVPKYVVRGFFLLGLLSALSFRSIIVLQTLRPSWIRGVWYLGASGYLVFFYYRFRISRKRKHAISDYRLIGKGEAGKPIDGEDRDVLLYLLRSVQVSLEDRNYELIFLLSILAILLDIVLHV